MNESLTETYGRVKAANLRQRLYPVPERSGDERDALDALVRAGVLLPVEGTSTSTRGYVALELPTQGRRTSH